MKDNDTLSACVTGMSSELGSMATSATSSEKAAQLKVMGECSLGPGSPRNTTNCLIPLFYGVWYTLGS
jgi:hypothetical protein